MLKKGFSLVELAIVLVIIGIIMSYVIKGKAMIEDAKLKAELSVIRGMEVALMAYLTDNDMVHPPFDNGGPSANHNKVYDIRVFINSGYLSLNDTYSKAYDARFIYAKGYELTNGGITAVEGLPGIIRRLFTLDMKKKSNTPGVWVDYIYIRGH